MAIKIYEKFTPFANPSNVDYPHGSIKNDSIPGAEDGTPLDADLGNDYVGFDAALLAEAGITPSGLPDTAINSQRLDAVKYIADTKAIARSLNVLDSQVVYATNTTTRLGPILYIHDAATQKTWAKPVNVGATETIVSVSAQGVLTTNLAVYQLINYTNKQAIEQSIGNLTGGMVVSRLDAKGNNNIMLKVPYLSLDAINEKLGTSLGTGPHPAFIRPDGTIRTHFEYGLYIASNDGLGNPVSAPFKAPYASVSYNSAVSKCAAMGTGWHLAHNAEWACIVWMCRMNGWDPLGNTNYGQSHASKYQTAIRGDGLKPGDASGAATSLTGSGPAAWRHDMRFGVADMVGNVWEWQGGFKTVSGQIFVDPACGNIESAWVGQAAWYNGDGKLANAKTSDNTSGSVTLWTSQLKDANYVTNPLLQSLLIEPVPQLVGLAGRLYFNNTIESIPVRGGARSFGVHAGLVAVYLSASRTYLGSDVGFRPAFSD